MAKSGFECTVAQIRAKIKALKKKYKSKRRQNVEERAGHESDIPADFLYFDMLHAVMGSRAAVTPVLLD